MSAPQSLAPWLRDALAGIRIATDEEIAAAKLAEARRTVAVETRLLRRQLIKWARHSSERWRGLVARKLWGVAERYEIDRGPLCIQGPAGVGKTLCLHSIAWRLLDSAWTSGNAAHPIVGACFVTALDLAIEARETRLGREAEQLDDARFAPLLLLDEIGQEQCNPGWLLELLDHRMKRDRVTLTTTGLTRRQLEDRYGSGATRRLVEPGGVFVDLFETAGGGASGR